MYRFLTVALACSLVLPSCRSPERIPGDQARKEKAREAMLAELANRHGADLEWRKPFEDGTRVQTYTVELQKVLIRSDGRPVVLIAFLHDIQALDDGQYEIRGRDSLILSPDLYVSLKCGAEQVAPILNRAPGGLDEYAFVVRVARVVKPMFHVSAEADSAGGGPRVVLESSDVVLVEGDCLEILRLKS